MSAGSMVAGGLAFTVPGLWMINQDTEVSFWPLFAVTLSGTVLGVIFTALIRNHFIENEKLPYPMGVAASKTLLTGDEGGSKAKTLFSTLGFSAVFTFIRDGLGWIPDVWNSATLAAYNISFGLWFSPMSIGIGYIIGPLFTGFWFLGGVFSYFFLIPVGLSLGWFTDVEAANAFKDSLGIGLMVGTGVGILLKGILPKAKEIYGPLLGRKTTTKGSAYSKWFPILFAAIAFVLTVFTDMPLLASVFTILGVWLTTAMSASITGQTGVNPMEIFGIIVLLLVTFFIDTTVIASFLIAAVVAIACGLTGDVLNDFKSGSILKTDPRAQIISESVGGIIGAVVSVIVLFVMLDAYGSIGPGTQLPAPQAYAVSAMVDGLPHVPAFWTGLAVGVILYLINIPGLTFGLGVYLPMYISATGFLGGLISWVVKKVSKKEESSEKGIIVSSGLFGGEGVMGVAIAIIRVLTKG